MSKTPLEAIRLDPISSEAVIAESKAPVLDKPSVEPTLWGLHSVLDKGSQLLLQHQFKDGYWWYTLEANDSINANFILLMHYIGQVNPDIQNGLFRCLLNNQNLDGSWSLYYDGPGDLSATIECYFALKLSGLDINSSSLTRARHFILLNGGVTKCRVFTRIHLALFGIVPWEACPAMPVQFAALPSWFPINIYEFSSWARACIVPLLILLHQKITHHLGFNYLSEIFSESSPADCKWSFIPNKSVLSIESLMIRLDPILHASGGSFIGSIGTKYALKKCEEWIREHIARTEDIYPALAYSAMALWSMGYPLSDPCISKCLKSLVNFQVPVFEDDLAALASVSSSKPEKNPALYQQCCISPVWDTPWAGCALIESGLPKNHPSLIQSAKWLLKKQILDIYGDWSIKNKKALPGGWSFEFENDYFPDVDDSVQVLRFLYDVELPQEDKKIAIKRGIDWILSMQSRNGGWAAFDKDNTLDFVNKIPFSDHGACLDPPTADITARVIELLIHMGYPPTFKPIQKAFRFLLSIQEKDGSWWGRWGVNYLYGTWCTIEGLSSLSLPLAHASIQKAVYWLKSVQNPDGGFGESCDSYRVGEFVPTDYSVPSQTAWALMGLTAAGHELSFEAQKAAIYLIRHQNSEGGWNEKACTGTGFPGHFYIRYHGYRHYFPLLALSKYYKKVSRYF